MDSSAGDCICGAVFGEFAADCCFEPPGQAGDYAAIDSDDITGDSLYRYMVPEFEEVCGI